MIFKTIDVAVGIAFFYLLITLAASAVVELISTWRNWRGEMLHGGIANLLSASRMVTPDEVYDSPLVTALARNGAAPSPLDFLENLGWRPRIGSRTVTFPSYIPAGAFSGAVLDVLIRKAGHNQPPTTPDSAVAAITTMLVADSVPDETKNDPLRIVIQTTFVTGGGNVPALQSALEKWFNDGMDRVTGWYKRRTQSCLLLVGLAFAFSCNINTIAVALFLWNGDAARQAVVLSAASTMQSRAIPAVATTDDGKTKFSDTLTAMATQVADIDREITALQFPIGWDHPMPTQSWFQLLAGCLLSAIAIAMGSAFWFDALQSLLKIRSAGPKPGER